MDMLTIHLRYFASIREKTGCSEESVETRAKTPEDILGELQNRYAGDIPTAHLRVAVNDAFATMDTPLKDGDTVVFIPPVAGG